MTIATGSALGISGTVTTTGDAFAVELPFSISYQSGVGFSDVTRITDTVRRKTYSLVLPGTIFMSAWWDDSLGSEPPHIPVGQELSDLTITMSTGTTFGTGTDGTAIITQQNASVRRGPSRQLLQYVIRFSGPVTPAFGPAFPSPSGLKTAFELYDGDKSTTARTLSTATRLFHYIGHAASMNSGDIIASFITFADGTQPDLNGLSVAIGQSYSATSPSLLVEGLRLVERINPNESKIQVFYRDFQFNFGNSAIVDDVRFGVQPQRVGIPIFSKHTSTDTFTTLWEKSVLEVDVGGIAIRERVSLPPGTDETTFAVTLADNINHLYLFNGTNVLFKGGSIFPVGGSLFGVIYTFTTRSAIAAIAANPSIGIDIGTIVVPPFASLRAIPARFNLATGVPSYQVIPANILYPSGALLTNSVSVPG